MFGFLIRRDVTDDAVRVKTLMESALGQYGNVSTTQLKADIARDFGSTRCNISGDSVCFVYKEIEEFDFLFDDSHPSLGARTLCATGKGRYLGISIYGDIKGSWFCCVDGGIAFRATAGAKAMARILDKRFGVKDMTEQFRNR